MTDTVIDGRARESAAPATAGELLDLVRTGRAHTRADLVRLTGLSRTAVGARVAALTDASLLVAGEELASTGGRPAGGLVFNKHAGVVLAAALGRSRSQLAVFDLDGGELAARSDDHVVGVGPDALMPLVAERLVALMGDRRVVGMGVSLPGPVDRERGMSVESPVVAGWNGVELAPYLRQVADAPVFVANDCDVLARSERLGRPELVDSLVVKASTGLGLGIIAEGRVLIGHSGAAGEIGHTRVEDPGTVCRCGASGCLETIAGGWALVDRLGESGRQVGHVRDLVALAIGGDRRARSLLRESGRRLGEVLAVAVNLTNPQAVVLGGDMPAAFDTYAAGVRETLYARAAAFATRDLQILPAAYADRAGLVGCAALALDHVLSPPSVDALLAH